MEIQPLVNGVKFSSNVMSLYNNEDAIHYVLFSYSVPHFYEININKDNSGQHNGLMGKASGRNKVPLSFLLPSTIPAVPHSAMPYQHSCCSIQSHLSCIKCKFQRIALTYAVEERVCHSDALAAVQSSAE